MEEAVISLTISTGCCVSFLRFATNSGSSCTAEKTGMRGRYLTVSSWGSLLADGKQVVATTRAHTTEAARWARSRCLMMFSFARSWRTLDREPRLALEPADPLAHLFIEGVGPAGSAPHPWGRHGGFLGS